MRTKPEEYYDDVGPGWRPILERLVRRLGPCPHKRAA